MKNANPTSMKTGEAFLSGLGANSGWTGDRLKLNQEDLSRLTDCISHPILIKATKLDFWLNHLFANFYAQVYNRQIAARFELYPDRPSFVRHECATLLTTLNNIEEIDALDRSDVLHAAMTALNPITYKFLNFVAGQFPTENFLRAFDFERRIQIISEIVNLSDVEQFTQTVARAHEITAANVKPGGNTDPILTQMCLALASLYLDATGKIPTRIRNPVLDTESGPLLRLARTMQDLIFEKLPDELKPAKKRSLTGACRDAINALKKEKLAKAA